MNCIHGFDANHCDHPAESDELVAAQAEVQRLKAKVNRLLSVLDLEGVELEDEPAEAASPRVKAD